MFSWHLLFITFDHYWIKAHELYWEMKGKMPETRDTLWKSEGILPCWTSTVGAECVVGKAEYLWQSWFWRGCWRSLRPGWSAAWRRVHSPSTPHPPAAWAPTSPWEAHPAHAKDIQMKTQFTHTSFSRRRAPKTGVWNNDSEVKERRGGFHLGFLVCSVLNVCVNTTSVQVKPLVQARSSVNFVCTF